jgi:hypothetical protein
VRTKIAQPLAWVALAAWLVAWFLPVLTDVPGWMAFRYALAPLVPYRDAAPPGFEDAVPQVMSALTNVVFVVMFGLWLRREFRASLFLRALLIINLYWLVMAARDDNLADLLFGYYVWLAAFLLLVAVASLSAFSSRRTSKTPTDDTPS